MSGRPAALDAHVLLDQARRRALLEDFGSGSFREGFDRLIENLNASADLHTHGRWAWRDEIVAVLVNRLGIRDWVKKNPMIRHEIVDRPLIVVGLDPVGVRLLAETLDHDPLLRAPQDWEASSIAPPAGIETYRTDARIATAGGEAGRADRGPASCDRLFEVEFSSPFMRRADVRPFGDWLAQVDMTPAYDQHQLQLQILQAAYPTERWLLYGTLHAWHLRAMLDRYPDAEVVWVHRDPAATTSRAVAQQRLASADRSDAMTAPGVVDWWTNHLAAGIDSATRVLAELNAEHVFHLQYLELADDPVGSVARVYRHFGVAFGTLARHRMQAAAFERQLTADANGRPGANQLEPLGEISADTRAVFGGYVQAFQIPREVS